MKHGKHGELGALPCEISTCVRRSRRKGSFSSKHTYFRRIPRNIRSLEVSSGDFSGAVVGVADDDSDAVEAAVDVAGEPSNAEEPDDVDAMRDD